MQPTATRSAAETETVLARQLGRPVVVMVSRSRSHGGWVAEVAALGVERRARSLAGVDRRIRALLGTNDVDYHFHTGDVELDRLVSGIRAAREAAQRSEARALWLTEQALLLPSGGTVRDLGVLVGLSYQRVHQLSQRRAAGRLSTVEGGSAA